MTHFKRQVYLACTALLSLLSHAHGGVFADDLAKTGASPKFLYQQTIDNGLLFVNGEFLPRPYRICANSDGVTINHKKIRSPFHTDAEQKSDRRLRRRPGEVWRRAAIKLGEFLQCGFIVISFADHPLEVISMPSQQRDFLRVILDRDPASDEFAWLLGSRRSDLERRQWTAWLTSFVLTEELQSLAKARVAGLDKVEARNIRTVRATLRLNTLAYPLTVFGMVMGVFSLGHLLRSAPKSIREAKHGPMRAEAIRASLVSIGLIIAMSGLDLTWTILAAQAGRIRELNPLGSELIAKPAVLIVFKVVVTLGACGILFTLRHHCQAQTASWWLCLVCLVLTFRWVMFNSMFIG